MQFKSLFSSVTFWGIVVSIVAKILLALQVFDLDEGVQQEVASWLANGAPLVIGFIGDGISMWGRINATKVIKKTPLTTAKTVRKTKQ